MKLNIIDRTSQTIVSKVTGAVMIGLTTGAAYFPIVEDAHTRIKETADLGLIAFIWIVRGDLHHRTAFNLLRREDAELHAHDGLNVRRMLIETGWHSVLEIEIVV